MPRIVAGLAKGRRLAVPAAGTRPTSDRAREALFNSLATLMEFEDARVLDLYAGTGAVGLEALSRRAGAAVFVESQRAACQLLRANIAAVGLPGATVRPVSVERFLARADGPAFDLVFADPPYELEDDAVDEMLATLVAQGLVADDAVLVIERAAHARAPRWPAGVEALRDKRYGAGTLWYGRPR